MRTRCRATLVVLVVAAACIGCGGAKSAAERWRDRATKACDERADTIYVASAQLTAQSTPEQFAAWFRQFFEPAYRRQLEALRAASPPDDTAKALVDDTAKVVDTMAADPGSFAIAQDPFSDVDARWDAYGLTACGTRKP